MIVLNWHRDAILGRILRRSGEASVTYEEVGGSRDSRLPSGYHHERVTIDVGSGEADWHRAREAIELWKAHENAGITISPADASPEEGTTVLATRSIGPLILCAPCRVVYRTDDSTRFGFAYGTLPGHPEQGEEAFHVVLHEGGTITAEIVAFSRPADLPTRLAGPVARQIQRKTTRRYVEGIQRYVASTG